MQCIGKVGKIILFENASSQLLHINSLYETEAQSGNSHVPILWHPNIPIYFSEL